MHIPKCGGQSIETAFLDDLGLSWRTRAPLLLRPNKKYELGPPRLAHLLAREYIKFKYVSTEQFYQYYKFSIVRCPVARVISMYNYLGYKRRKKVFPLNYMGRKKEFPLSLSQFIHDWLPSQFLYAPKYAQENNRYEGDYFFVRPQYDYLTDENGNLLVDQIFAIEDLSDNYPLIKSKCGLKSDLKHVNASKVQMAKKEDLKPQDLEVIQNLYKLDFEMLSKQG